MSKSWRTIGPRFSPNGRSGTSRRLCRSPDERGCPGALPPGADLAHHALPANGRAVGQRIMNESIDPAPRKSNGSAAHVAPFLRIRNLVKRFGAFIALQNVSLDVMRGEFVCF